MSPMSTPIRILLADDHAVVRAGIRQFLESAADLRVVAVRNDGDAPLVVTEVLTTCGCTTAALEPMTLAPGEAGNLHIIFDSGAHGPELTGPIMRRVILVSNDPILPEATVDLQAVILPPEAAE